MYRQLVSGLVSTVCVAAALVAGGCAAEEEAESGTVELDLVGAGPSGTVYVLRNAEIVVTQLSDSSTRVFRTDDDVGATRLSAHVLTGDYSARLSPGWRLHRRTSSGYEEPVVAALTSSNPAAFTVATGATTRVALRFTVGGDGVTLDAGDFDIEIDIDEPELGSIGNKDPFPNTHLWNAYYLAGQRFDLPANATLLRFGYIAENNQTRCRFAVYRDSIDVPGALVAQTQMVNVVGTRVEVDLVPTSATAGRYWLMALCEGNPLFRASYQQVATTRAVSMSVYADLPATFPAAHDVASSQPAVNFYLVVDYH